MQLYLVKVRQEIEWEDLQEAPNANVAEEMAVMDARSHGTVVDTQVIVEEVQPVEVAD